MSLLTARTYRNLIGRMTLVTTLFALPLAGAADTYRLAVQPVLTEARTAEFYAPLADYLSERTGQSVQIVTSRDFYSYWTRLNRGEFDFTLDAAHFTGYQLKNLGYQVLASLPDTVSYTLITAEDRLVLSADELIGKPVATMGPPSLGAIRLEQLYDNPMREPRLISTATAIESIEMVRSGRVAAAMVPTPLIAGQSDLNSVLTTTPTPHLALSSANTVPTDVRVAVQATLLSMSSDPQGSAVLVALQIPRFQSARATRYLPYASLIENSRANYLASGGGVDLTKFAAVNKPAAVTNVALAPLAE